MTATMKTPWVLRGQIVLSVMLAITTLVLSVITWRTNITFDPLIPFKTQTVLSRTKDRAGPSIEVSMDPSVPLPTLAVVGRKCYREDTEIVATRSWQSEYPPGLVFFDMRNATANKKQGCDGSTKAVPFLNPLPLAVASTVRSLYIAQGIRVTRWRVNGLVTPISPHGDKVIPRHWETEEFTIAVIAPPK